MNNAIATPDIIYTEKRVEEVDLFGMNFARLIPTGDSLLEATVTATIVSGRGNSAGMIRGLPIINGTWVKQLVGGGLKGGVCHLRFMAKTINGLELTGLGQFEIVD